MNKERADRLVVDQGLAENQQKAQTLIMAGLVFSQNERIEKPGQLVASTRVLTLKETLRYVSRGGLKLEEALEEFEYSVAGKTAADLGASTGGFSDCLLQHGASKVYAVDVDTRQLDWKLRQDPRMILIKKNARFLEAADFPGAIDIFTLDLAFISILKVLPALARIPGEGIVLTLIKPQFEVEKGQVGKKGIVRDPAQHEAVLIRIIEAAGKLGYFPQKVMKASVKGQKGNREFFVLWSNQPEPGNKLGFGAKVRKAVWNEKD